MRDIKRHHQRRHECTASLSEESKLNVTSAWPDEGSMKFWRIISCQHLLNSRSLLCNTLVLPSPGKPAFGLCQWLGKSTAALREKLDAHRERAISMQSDTAATTMGRFDDQMTIKTTMEPCRLFHRSWLRMTPIMQSAFLPFPLN